MVLQPLCGENEAENFFQMRNQKRKDLTYHNAIIENF
jgi:hypothetical protein